MADGADRFADEVTRRRIAGVCLALGWQSAYQSSLDIMVDLMKRYVKEIGRITKASAEICERSEVNLSDVEFALTKQMKVDFSELEDYMANFSPKAVDTRPVVQFPAKSEMNLNFLKPGSREVLHRKTHIFDYLPPMYPELEETEEDIRGNDSVSANPHNESVNPDMGDNSNLETTRGAFSDQHHPVREIASVMMTSAGFISPAIEGKLPESRTPATVSTREVPSTPALREASPAPFETKPPTTKEKAKAKAKATPRQKKQKLSVFQKKPTKAAAASSSPKPAKSPETRGNADDIIDSVIERGVIESERLEVKQQPIKKKTKQDQYKSEEFVNSPTPSPSPPPPPAPAPIPEPKPKTSVVMPPNPLLNTLYGFGSQPSSSKSDTTLIKHEKEKSRDKPKKAKSSKKDSEKHEKRKKDKKEKKKKQDKDKDRKDKAHKPSEGLKIKFKDSSSSSSKPEGASTKVVLKGFDTKRKTPEVAGPSLFQEPIKLERPLFNADEGSSSKAKRIKPPTPTPPVQPPPPKRKRAAAPTEMKEPEERFEGGGHITTQTVGHYIDAEGNQVWICPACSKQDDGSPMIGCDECDDWYHWLCVGIQQEPAETQNWFCMRCVAKKQSSGSSKKSRPPKQR